MEFTPGEFSIKVFNALYVAKCMQNSGSMTPFIAIMAFDAFKSMLMFRSMKARSQIMYVTSPVQSVQSERMHSIPIATSRAGSGITRQNAKPQHCARYSLTSTMRQLEPVSHRVDCHCC